MTLEEGLIYRGIWPLCGVDEAGRGPLAGPVVAAAVILDPSSPLRPLVRDSKTLSPRRRAELFELLMTSDAVHVGIAIVDERTIDAINILNATLLAMERAVCNLRHKPACALIDGNHTPTLACECIPVVDGDNTQPSISAASIVAKVTRDRYMVAMDARYPGYGFAIHKGYPTKAHCEAIRSLGPSPIHRRSYKGVTQLEMF